MTVNIHLFSQQVKNTLNVTFTSKTIGDTGSIEFNFENGTGPYSIAVVNTNLEKTHTTHKTENKTFIVNNLSLGHYSIAVFDKNNLFFISSIDLK